MLSPSNAPAREPFWPRQFNNEPTIEQAIFDFFAGIFLPVCCLLADPVVFRGSGFGAPVLGNHALLAYLLVGAAILSLVIWLTLGRPAALLTGALFAGAAFAVGLGVVLLPFSLIGLSMIIGVFGFTPFLTAFTYFRNGVRAWRRAECGIRPFAIAAATVGFLAVCGLPALVQSHVDRTVAQAVELTLSDNADDFDRGVAVLRWYRFGANLDKLVWAYSREKDEVRKTQLADSYRDLTGTDIEHRLMILND